MAYDAESSSSRSVTTGILQPADHTNNGILMETIVDDYLYSCQLSEIDNQKLFNKCLVMERIINETTPPVEKGWYGNYTSAKNQFYNLYTFPVKELTQLYFLLQKSIYPVLDPNTDYMLKAWMNVYYNGDSVSWHPHWPAECNVWHGFYCVNVGDNESATLYKIPGISEVITVPSKNGKLVFGKSAGDLHRSTPWTQEKPTITLAFDVIPSWVINKHEDTTMDNIGIHHYIPFKSSLIN